MRAPQLAARVDLLDTGALNLGEVIRPFGGTTPPAAAYYYSPDRGAEHPAAHMAGVALHDILRL
jgi:hypothetical protein